MIKFSKYQGLGNDFVLIDAFNENLPNNILSPSKTFIQTLCHRNFGIGADGVIIILPSTTIEDLHVKIFNTDGTEAEMCGNGIRCVAKYIMDNNLITKDTLRIRTLAGVIITSIVDDNLVQVGMGKPIFSPEDISTKFNYGLANIPEGIIDVNGEVFTVYSISMGNPHAIIFVNNLSLIDLHSIGPKIETHRDFPKGTNVHFVQLVNRSNFKMLIWERGSGATLACGTGACACAVCSFLLGYTNNKVRVSLPGGDLNILWPDENSEVLMKGPAKLIFKGTYLA